MRPSFSLWTDETPGFCEAYGQEPPAVTLYPAARPKGLMIVLPGGGYTHLAAHEGEPIALTLNGFGWSALVLRYRLHPYGAPVPQWDVRRAVRLARHHAEAWGIPANRILIMGFSAGAHLAACAAYQQDGWAGSPDSPDPVERQSARPDGAVLCYGVLTMGRFTHAGSRDNLLGARASDPKTIQEYSLENRVTDDAPPTFLWHTAEDGAVPVENSLQLAAALSAHHVPFETHIFPHGRHGLGLAEGMPGAGQWPGLLRSWLDEEFPAGRP